MTIAFTEEFTKKVSKLTHKDPLLKKKFLKQIELFQQNPLHPSLKLHKLKGQRSKEYAIWIEGDLRALCIPTEETYVFFDLVTHDKY
jgi:proteic killer suppression protein